MLLLSIKSVRDGQQTIFWFSGDGLKKLRLSQRVHGALMNWCFLV